MRGVLAIRAGTVVAVVVGAAVALPLPAHAAATLDVSSAVAATPFGDSNTERTVTATCPAGTRVLGGGAWTGYNPDVHITGMLPNAAANSVTAYARNHGPSTEDWFMAARAFCAPAPPGLIYVVDFTGGDSSPSKSLYAWCPPGRKVLGVGGRVTAPDTSRVILTAMHPTGTGNGAEVAAVERPGGYAGNWFLHAWAVCADPPEGWDIAAAYDDDGDGDAMAWCQPVTSQRLTGGGILINPALSDVYTSMIRTDGIVQPDGDVINAGIFAEASWTGRDRDDPGTGHDWRVKAFSICVHYDR